VRFRLVTAETKACARIFWAAYPAQGRHQAMLIVGDDVVHSRNMGPAVPLESTVLTLPAHALPDARLQAMLAFFHTRGPIAATPDCPVDRNRIASRMVQVLHHLLQVFANVPECFEPSGLTAELLGFYFVIHRSRNADVQAVYQYMKTLEPLYEEFRTQHAWDLVWEPSVLVDFVDQLQLRPRYLTPAPSDEDRFCIAADAYPDLSKWMFSVVYHLVHV
jgi:hypothetical protein